MLDISRMWHRVKFVRWTIIALETTSDTSVRTTALRRGKAAVKATAFAMAGMQKNSLIEMIQLSYHNKLQYAFAYLRM